MVILIKDSTCKYIVHKNGSKRNYNDLISNAFYLELTELGNIIHKICWADSFFTFRG